MTRLSSLFTRPIIASQSTEVSETQADGDCSPPVALDPIHEIEALYDYLFEHARRADYETNAESDVIRTTDGAELLGRIQEDSKDGEIVIWMGVCLTADKSACVRRVSSQDIVEIQRGLGVSPEERDQLRTKAGRLVANGVPGLSERLDTRDWRLVAREEPLRDVVRRLWGQGIACACDPALAEAVVTVDIWEGAGREVFDAVADSAGCRYGVSSATINFVR